MSDPRRDRQRQDQLARDFQRQGATDAPLHDHSDRDPAPAQLRPIIIQEVDEIADVLKVRRVWPVGGSSKVFTYLDGPDAEDPNAPIEMSPWFGWPVAYCHGLVWEGAANNDPPNEYAHIVAEIRIGSQSLVLPIWTLITTKALDANYHTVSPT